MPDLPGTTLVENTTDYRIGSPFAQEPPGLPEDNALPGGGVGRSESAGKNLPAGSTLGGSPFAPTHGPLAADEVESIGDGVWGETAAAAAYSAVILLLFAIACWMIFPAGGVAVTVLGAVVSLFGLSSKRRRLATATLTLHGGLFFACYLRAI